MFKKSGISGQNRPDLNALHQLLSQGLEKRGKQCQLTWRGQGGLAFTLILLCSVRGDPKWCLYSQSEQNAKHDLLFDYDSCDPLMVFNLVSTSCTAVQGAKRSPFLGSTARSTHQKLPELRPEPLPAVSHNDDPADQSAMTEADSADFYVVEASESTSQTEVGAELPLAWPMDKVHPQSTNDAAFGDPATAAPATVWPENQSPSSDPFANISPGSPQTFSAKKQTAAKVEPETTPAVEKTLILKSRPIDGSIIQSVMMKLRRPDTGLFLYAAFLYFLEEEFFRNYRSKTNLSLIVFEMCERKMVDGSMVRNELPPRATVDAVLRIADLKRNVDFMGHYCNEDYALILPNTKVAGTKTFANRVIKLLTESPLPGVEPDHLSIAMGAASIPEDFGDLGKLIGAAELALSQARATKTKLIMFHDIKDAVKT